MHDRSGKTSGSQNQVSGFLRLFVLCLLIAAFACSSLNAQTLAYVTNFRSNSVSVIDTSTNRDSNTWKQNTFGTANQTCIH